MYLNFIRVNTVWPQTPAHCLIWWLVDFGFYFVACILATWASIERHILVFHNSWLATRNRRLLIHYLPLLAILIYGTSFYTWVIFFLPCENTYEYDLPVCGALPCHSNDPIIGSWEVGAHGCGCTFLLIIFSIGLVIRVIHEKRTRQQPVVWRKHRKMTLQMLFISAAFVIFNLPIMVMFMAHYLGLPADVGVEVQLYFFFLTYWLQFVLPFASLKSLPHAKQKLFRIFRKAPQRQTTIGVVLQNQAD